MASRAAGLCSAPPARRRSRQRHAHVADDHVVAFAQAALETDERIVVGIRLMAVRLQYLDQVPAEGRVVVDDQNAHTG
jgi:hypothetical protein